MTGGTRRFLDENRLKLGEGRLVGSGPIVFDVSDLQYIKFMLENCANPSDTWNPIDWDNVDEVHKTYWHGLIGRIRGNSPFEVLEFREGCFCVKDPANGPVDMQNRLFVIELTPTLLEDLIRELGQTGPDGIIPVQGFKA